MKFAETVDQAVIAAEALLGMDLRGTTVEVISIEPKLNYEREFYVGITWDTVAKLPVALLSLAGGVDVESAQSRSGRTSAVRSVDGTPALQSERRWLPKSA